MSKTKQSYQVYLKHIQALSKVADLITSGLYLEEVLRLIVSVTAEIMNSKICSLMLLDPDKSKVERVMNTFLKMKKLDIAELKRAYRG